MTDENTARVPSPGLPPRDVLIAQDELLAPMRSRIFRRIGIAHLGPVLDLGAGPGVVTGELARRARGPVIALDRDPVVKAAPAEACIVADATKLPFPAGHFELIYVQYVFLWNDAEARRRIIDEIVRVLAPRGVLVAVEPDYEGALEHPAEVAIAPVVAAAIRRAGGEPAVGRRLPAELGRAGLSVRVEQSPEVGSADPERFDHLGGLLFTEAEADVIRSAERAARALPDGQSLAHVPQLFITATP